MEEMMDPEIKDVEPYVIKDVGPYPIYSTVLLTETPEMGEEYRRARRFFCYSIGGVISGSNGLAATRLETNMNVANQFVDEEMRVESIDLAIPKVAQAVYQVNFQTGPYTISEQDVAGLAAETYAGFYCGGEKPFVEAALANRVIVPAETFPTNLNMNDVFSGAGGWLVRIADFGKTVLPIGRLEKFWGEISWPRAFPKFGRHGYNPAVVPIAMILNGQRARGVR